MVVGSMIIINTRVLSTCVYQRSRRYIMISIVVTVCCIISIKEDHLDLVCPQFFISIKSQS